MQEAHIGARIGIAGTLEFRNDAGEIIKTMELNGSIPLSALGLSAEHEQALIQEAAHGTHDRERGA